MSRARSPFTPGRQEPLARPGRALSVGDLAPSPANFPLGETTLVLPLSVRARIDAWVRAGYPEEVCGLLVGACVGSLTTVTRAVRAPNLAREHRGERYELDPVAFVVTDRGARAEGLSIVGVWHSHPEHPPVPSQADRLAAWADLSYLIVQVDEAGVRGREAYRLEGERFVRERVVE
jgi:proteasome lid subunit RPN8/RPN11